MQKATGECITFLDSDDILHPDKLLTVHAIFIENPEINIVIHNLSSFNEYGIVKEKIYQHENSFKKNILIELLESKFLPYSSYVFKKKIAEDIGLIDEELYDGQHDFLARLVAENSVYFEPRSFIKLREHSNSMSKSMSEEMYQKYTLGAFKEYLVTLKNLYNKKKISKQQWRSLKSHSYYMMGVRLKRQNRIQEANKCFRECISIHPFTLNSLKALIQYNYIRK